MSKNTDRSIGDRAAKGNGSSSGLGSIRHKIIILILILSFASFTGFGIFIVNGVRLQGISRGFSEDYNESLARECFNEFNSFLDSIQVSSGMSQNFGEHFYALKDTLNRAELARTMEATYHNSFAREMALLGGGAFYEPNAFYPEVYDFHYFASKLIGPSGLPAERDVKWAGDEWAWDVDTYEEGWYQIALPKGWNRSTPRQDRYHWSELYVDTSVDVLMVSVCLPIYSPTRQIVGVATVDVSLSTLQEMLNSFTLPTRSAQMAGFSTINNATFALTGESGSDIVDYPKDSWLSHLSQLKPGQVFNNGNLILDGKSYTLTASVHDSGIGLAILVPNAEKYEAADAIQRTNLIATAAIFLVMLGIIFVTIIALSRWIVSPIRRASLVFETLARGDLTQNIVVKGRDELAQMMQTLGQTQESIKMLIKSIGEKARALSSVGIEMQGMMNDSVEVINRINASTKDMKAKSVTQAEGVARSSTAMGQIISNI
ncbi:MAG: methyl-accepting chemotaxis protein, partial [Treponema sp.]|nr:methyl-accepting chemotaxis protein [Treponema sp.]